MSQKEREPVASEVLHSDFGRVCILKFENPLGYSVSLKPLYSRSAYVAELGEAASPDPVIADVTESIQIGAAPLDYQPLNAAHIEIMDRLKLICEGNDHRYVIRQLQKLSESMKPSKTLRK